VSGAAFFAEAMQILASAERAVAAARQAGDLAPVLHVGTSIRHLPGTRNRAP
jgi:hypothetical protein